MKQQSQQKRQQRQWSWTLSIHHMNQNLESFTTALLKLPSTELQKKATDSERKN